MFSEFDLENIRRILWECVAAWVNAQDDFNKFIALGRIRGFLDICTFSNIRDTHRELYDLVSVTFLAL